MSVPWVLVDFGWGCSHQTPTHVCTHGIISWHGRLCWRVSGRCLEHEGLCCCLRKWPTGGKGPGAVLQGDVEEVLFHMASGEGEPASR